MKIYCDRSIPDESQNTISSEKDNYEGFEVLEVIFTKMAAYFWEMYPFVLHTFYKN